MIKALIIVDVQNDYFRGGSMELVSMDTAANNCRQLLEKFREYDLPIYHIQHFGHNRTGLPGKLQEQLIVSPTSYSS